MGKAIDTTFGNARTAVLLVLLSVVCFGFIALRQMITGESRFLFLIWNLFLAWLPYVVSTAASQAERLTASTTAKGAIAVLFGIPWLLLFPNAPYLTTDFIHLVANKSVYISKGDISYLFWYDLVLFFLFSWCGLFLGYLSSFQFHKIVERLTGVVAGWLFIVLVSLLGGYGIFLGRVVRLNSWDALFNPFRLLYDVLENIHRNGFLFSTLFAFFLFIIYIFLYSLREKKG